MKNIASQGIIKMLLGAAIGFIVIYFVLGWGSNINIEELGLELTIAFLAITVALLLYSFISYLKIKRDAKRELSGEAEDELEKTQYNRFNNTLLAVNSALYSSTLQLAIVALTDVPNILIFITLGLLVLSVALTTIYSGVLQSVYPQRDLPEIGDKNYAQKLFAASDEGERHIMLQGLHSSFKTLNMLLFFVLFIQIGYSVVSGVSQLFAISCIVIVLIASNVQYHLKIKSK